MYCSNCGAKVNENAVVCVKCGAAVNRNNVQTINNAYLEPSQKNTSGAATASLVLGIIGLVIGVITFIIFMLYYEYAVGNYKHSYYNYFYTFGSKQTEMLITSVSMMFLPGVLSIIGLPLGIFSKIKENKGAKIAGIILNIITLILSIIPIVLATIM